MRRSITHILFVHSFYILIATGVFFLDVVTKWMAARKLQLYESVEIIPNLFDLTYVQNTGIAFGLFRDAAWRWKGLLLSAIAVATVIIIVYYSRKVPVEKKYVHLALALVLGGILGNLFDRALYGYVIDFLDFHWYEYHWPTFNVADSAITVSMILLVVYALKSA